MVANENSEEASNKPIDNVKCTCSKPHKDDKLKETQRGLVAELEFNHRQVRPFNYIHNLWQNSVALDIFIESTGFLMFHILDNLRTLNFYSAMGAEQGECSKKSYPLGPDGKPLKPCCACPETKRNRDACIIEKGEENCSELIEAHKACMRSLGFNI